MERARFVVPLAVYPDFTGEDHGERFLRRLCNSTLDKENISRLRIALGFIARRRFRCGEEPGICDFTSRKARSPKGASSAMAFVASYRWHRMRASSRRRPIGCLFLRDILARVFPSAAEDSRRPDIVGNLKCPTDGFSEAAKARDVVVTCAGTSMRPRRWKRG